MAEGPMPMATRARQDATRWARWEAQLQPIGTTLSVGQTQPSDGGSSPMSGPPKLLAKPTGAAGRQKKGISSGGFLSA
eukprot:5098232-Pyramimonas_sp.AAC.1